MSESEEERAALWAAYFALRALHEPPVYLAEAEAELREFLEGAGDRAADLPVGQRRLRLVE